MSAPATLPLDPGTLGPWLIGDPKRRGELFRRFVARSVKARYAVLEPVLRQGLCEAWDREPRAFFELIEAWRGGRSVRLRQLIAGALPLGDAAIAKRGLPWLKELAADPNRDVRLAAIARLCEAHEHCPEELERFAIDKDPLVRVMAARAAGDAGSLAAIKPVLEKVCRDRNSDVHEAAAASLYLLYSRDPEMVLELAAVMGRSEDVSTRWAVAGIFFAPAAGDAFDAWFPILQQFIKKGERNLLWTVAHSLRFAPSGAHLTRLLQMLYEGGDAAIRRRVIVFVANFDGRLDEPTVRSFLERGIEDSSKLVRSTSTGALARLEAEGIRSEGSAPISTLEAEELDDDD